MIILGKYKKILKYFPVFAWDKTIRITHPSTLIKEREAIVILVGFRNSGKGWISIKKYFSNCEYDVFVPDYIDRDSVNGCCKAINIFWRKMQEIYCFSGK